MTSPPLSPLRLLAAATGYAIGADVLVSSLTPDSFSAWTQSVIGALWLASSTALLFWERRQAVIRRAQARTESDRHGAVMRGQGQLSDQIGLGAVERGLSDSATDRAQIHARLDQLQHQLAEVGHRTSHLVCPLADAHGGLPCAPDRAPDPTPGP